MTVDSFSVWGLLCAQTDLPPVLTSPVTVCSVSSLCWHQCVSFSPQRHSVPQRLGLSRRLLHRSSTQRRLRPVYPLVHPLHPSGIRLLVPACLQGLQVQLCGYVLCPPGFEFLLYLVKIQVWRHQMYLWMTCKLLRLIKLAVDKHKSVTPLKHQSDINIRYRSDINQKSILCYIGLHLKSLVRMLR